MTATTCDTGSSLLRAVLADPASDAARLIYADWLEEQGERDRAEFVRVQVELAKPHRGIEKLIATVGHLVSPSAVANMRQQAKPELVERERELWAQNRQAWEVRCPGFDLGPASRAWWVRGFLTEIHLPLSAFLEHARDLFSRHPITAVVISDAVIHPSGGNDTYYLGGLGRFPKEYWRRLDGLPSVRAVQDAVSGVCVHWGRSLAGLPPLG